jgi:MHS family alpha-ketoglutarate permease-like MFS transporter
VVVLPFAALLSDRFGRLSDRFGRRPPMLVYVAAFVILPFPLLSMLGSSFASVLVVSLVGMAFLLLNHSNLATVFAELFPPQVRTIGIALPYAISNAIFGGTAPSGFSSSAPATTSGRCHSTSASARRSPARSSTS